MDGRSGNQGPTPRPGILDILPYKGGDGSLPGFERVIKLASNEGALGPSPKAMEALARAAGELHRYPDGGTARLRQAIGAHFKLDPERIVCGAGSDQLLELIGRAYAGPGDEVLYSAHGFMWYPIVARAVGAKPVTASEKNLTADVDALLAAVTPRTKIVYLANPNNPTGTCLPASEVARLHAGLPSHVVLVIDAAYAEYVDWPAYSAGVDLVDRAANVVMTRTFSKLYALSHLRLGWAYASPGIVDVLNRIRAPFNVNGAAQSVGIAALADTTHAQETKAHTTHWRNWLSRAVRDLGLSCTDSHGNFVLVKCPDQAGRTAHDADDFLRSKGIIARRQDPCGLKGHLRITVGTGEECQAVAEALKAFTRGW